MYINLDFQIINRVNVIIGESGISKSKLIKDLSSLMDVYESGNIDVQSSIPFDCFAILDGRYMTNEAYITLENDSYVIFIDDYDRYDSKN